MKIAYFDDLRVHLEAFAEEFSDVFSEDELSLYTSVNEVLRSGFSSGIPDIIFMDIDFNGAENGIDYASEFYRLSKNTRIIYVTAYTDKFIHEIFLKKANVSGFLTKPVQRKYLLAMLDEARKQINGTAKKITVSFKNTISTVDEKDILYIESDRHVIKIIMENEQLSSYEKLSDFMKKLSSSFASPHKSYAVNMDKIRNITSARITLENGASVPVSRSKYHEFKELYMKHLKNNLF